MKLENIPIGVGPHSDMAQRVLFNAFEKRWIGIEKSVYFEMVIMGLAAGQTVEESISNAEVGLIVANVQE